MPSRDADSFIIFSKLDRERAQLPCIPHEVPASEAGELARRYAQRAETLGLPWLGNLAVEILALIPNEYQALLDQEQADRSNQVSDAATG